MKEQMVWEILGIEPTDDTDLIRDAYRANLVNTNPEDDPEGFMQLKEAYDTALQLAEGKENDEQERPYSDIIARVDEIYKDIDKRMDVQCWKELFKNPIFMSLDDQDGIRREFLAYTMDHYKYSGEVLKIIDNTFTILQDEKDLTEVFPPDFISFLCNNIENDGDYVLSEKPVTGRANGVQAVNDIPVDFSGELQGKAEFEYDIDEYISTLNCVISNFRQIESSETSEEDKAAELVSLAEAITQLREYDFYHPYEEIAVIRYLYYTENYEECFKLLENRINATVMAGEKHSDYYYSHLIFMYLRFFVQDIHKDMNLTISPDVLEKCGAALSKTMDQIFVNETHPAQGLYYYLKGEKRRAAEYLSYAADYIQSATYTDISDQIDKERFEELPGMIEAEPDNLSYKISLAWIYTRQEKSEEALKVLENVSEEDKLDVDYNNIMGRLHMNNEEFSESIPYLLQWNKLLTEKYGYDKNPDKNNYPIEEVRQIERVPFSYYLLSASLLNAGDLEKAKECVLLALQGAPMRDYYHYTDLYNFLIHQQKAYEEGLEFWSREVDKDNPYIAICRGNRQFMAHMVNDARTVIDDYFYLRERDPMYSDSYVFAEDVYLDYSDTEGFEYALKYIENAGVQDVRLDFNMARYLRMTKKYKEALEVFESVEKAIQEGYEGIENPYRFYVSYGYCLMDYDRTDVSEDEHNKIVSKIKELVDTSKELYPDNTNVHWLGIDYCERYTSEAGSAYEEMLEKFPDDAGINYEYGRYLENEGDDEGAGAQFEIGLEKNPDHVNIRYELSDNYNDYKYKELELEEYNEKALEISDKILELKYDSRAAVHYALILMDGLKYEEAYKFCEKAVEDFSDAPYVHNAFGLSCMYLKKYEEAEKHFKDAIELFTGTTRFASYTNLVRLYEMQNKHDEAISMYLKYTEKYELDEVATNERLGDLYDNVFDYDTALSYHKRAFYKKLSKLTEKDFDDSIPLSMQAAVKAYPDIAPEKLGDAVCYLRQCANTLSYADRMDGIYEIEKDIIAYLDSVDIFRPVEEMTDEFREDITDAVWEAAYHFTFVRRDPEAAIKYFERYIAILMKKAGELKAYHDNIYEAYDLMGRCYLYLGNQEKASECADKSFENLEMAYNSVEQYLSYKRRIPLRACKLSGLYLYKGNREEMFRLLDMTDTCLRCTHCQHNECVDKIDRLALLADLDGDYEKAIEYYELGIKLGGNDIERTSGIRECRKKIQ